MRHTGLRRTRRGRRKGHLGSRGGSRGFFTRASRHSPSASSSTSSVPETRVSKHQPSGWWAPRSSWRGWHAVYYVLCSAYSPSLVADGDPTTRRTEDCPDAWKARRCRWLGVVDGRALHNALPRADSTRPPATYPAYPAGKRTNGSGGTARRTQVYSHKLCWFSRRDHIQNRHRLCNRRRVEQAQQRVQGSQAALGSQPWGARATLGPQPPRGPSGLHLATYPSQVHPTASSSSVPPNCDPNKAINYPAILFIRNSVK